MKHPIQSRSRLEKQKPPLSQAKGRSKLRFAFYAAGALFVVLTLAYIDGGEEPLHKIVHPIVQSVPTSTVLEHQS